MDGFSGTLRLTDLNDFIAPTQECIKPVKIERKPGKISSIKITSSGDYAEVDARGVETKLTKASITLNDCLACSGCVTSAETVLIQLQSAEELYKVLDENSKVDVEDKKVVVVSLSDQAVASLANRYGLSMREALAKLAGFLRSLGVDKIFEIGTASALSLMETQREFVDRYRSGDRKSALPMLTSACPGWICYAEKTHGSFILPFISTTKSPQQAMGSLVKNHLAALENKSPSQIYHVAVMMCYDKKLEASRDDFYDDLYRTQDVDCVITSLELEQMLDKKGITLAEFCASPVDTFPGQDTSFHASGGGAGGYLENVLSYAAKELFDTEIGPIEYKIIRNSDFREVTIQVNGETKLCFAAAYGFRNIQNIVQKMKRGKCNYDFVEIMACPSACLNGGGQIRPPEPAEAKVWLQNVHQLFDSLVTQDPNRVDWIRHLYQAWIGNDDDTKRLKLLHTRYHSLENKSNALNIKW